MKSHASRRAVASILKPRDTWVDKAAYEATARRLAWLFIDNFRTYAPAASEEVRKAGPAVG